MRTDGPRQAVLGDDVDGDELAVVRAAMRAARRMTWSALGAPVLGEGGTAVLDRASRDRLEVTDLLRGGLAVVRLEEPDDDVPEFTTRHWWEALLHNQSAWLLKAELAKRDPTP